MKQTFNLKSYFTFLSRNKAYTAINVFGLSISLMFVLLIGVYTWQERSVDHQHAKAGRIYALGVHFAEDRLPGLGLHHAVLRHFRQRYPEVENTCGFIVGGMRLERNGEYYNAVRLETDSTFFSMFDFKLLQGDRKTCLSDKHNVVLTESFARKWFGTDDVLGREVVANDSVRFRVTGVVQDFTNTIINERVEMLVDFSWARYSNAANADENFPNMVNVTGASTFVQVREGAKMLGREAEFTKFIHSFWPSFNDKGFRCQLTLQPLDNLYFSGLVNYNDNLRNGNANLVNILFAAGLVILLFAIMNYINLTVAQSGYRSREMATRRLFGAGRPAIVARLIVESTMLCVLSMCIAVALALAFAPAAGRLLTVTIDMAVLARPMVVVLLLALVLLMGIVSGIIPAMVLSRAAPIAVVRGTFRRHTKMVLSKVFIVVQNVITIVMLASALIMMRQVSHLVHAPMGFNTKNLLTIDQGAALASKDYPVFLDRLRQLPQVRMVVPSMGTPQDGGNNNTVIEEGRNDSYQMLVGEPDFLKIYGLKVKADHGVRHRPVVYLNAMAVNCLKMKPTDHHMSDYYKKLDFYGFPKEAAFGGVLQDFKLRNIERNVQQPMLVCLVDKVEKPWSLTVQVEGDLVEAYQAIQRLYKEVYHEELDEAHPYVDSQIEADFERELRTARIVALFSFVAIIISLLGLVAMSTYFIQQRRKEIAIRKVFGSTGNQVRLRLIRTFLGYVAVAFVLSVPVVWYFMADWVSQYSYRITWWPWIIVAGILVLLISFVAVVAQSWMASNGNPVNNIKQE